MSSVTSSIAPAGKPTPLAEMRVQCAPRSLLRTSPTVSRNPATIALPRTITLLAFWFANSEFVRTAQVPPAFFDKKICPWLTPSLGRAGDEPYELHSPVAATTVLGFV